MRSSDPKRGRKVSLACPQLSDEEYGLCFGDVFTLKERADAWLRELWCASEVKAFQGLDHREACLLEGLDHREACLLDPSCRASLETLLKLSLKQLYKISQGTA